MSLKVEIKGAEKIKALGNKITVALQSSFTLAPIRADAARIVADSNRRSFQNQRGPRGEDWPPRAQPKRGRRIVSRKQLLVDTGAMRDTLLSPQTRIDNLGQRLTISYSGAHQELIKFHNFGTRFLPRRPVGLAIDAQGIAELSALAVKRIGESFSKALKG